MKIAVASMGNDVAGHFGHCENFNIYMIEGGSITAQESIPNPGHKPGFLPNYLGEIGVNVIISGGMGGGAIDIFNRREIEVVTGASGSALVCVERYLQGELHSTGSVCQKHEYAGECHK